MGTEGEKISLADLQKNLRAGDTGGFRLVFSAGRGTFGQELGAAAIIEKLAEVSPEAGAAEDERISEQPGTNAGTFAGGGSRDADTDLGSVGAADLPRDLSLCLGHKASGGEGGVVAQG